MKAARIHEFGAALRIDDVDEPGRSDGDIVVAVRFAAVNPLDVWVTKGTIAGGRQRLPFIPGSEAVGEVDGRPVLVHGNGVGVTRDGTYRERADVPSGAVVDLPEGLDPERAAGLGVTGPTAIRLVEDVARVEAGDRVLVLGASGGVGTLLVPLAKARGATVWGQTSSQDKRGFVEQLGADDVVVADAATLVETARDVQATVVFDALGDGFTTAAVEAMAPFGRIVLFGASAGPEAERFDLRGLYRKSIQLLTYSGTIEPPDRLRDAMGRALNAAARGELRVVIDEVLPLERAAEAHDRIEHRRVRGKLVLAL